MSIRKIVFLISIFATLVSGSYAQTKLDFPVSRDFYSGTGKSPDPCESESAWMRSPNLYQPKQLNAWNVMPEYAISIPMCVGQKRIYIDLVGEMTVTVRLNWKYGVSIPTQDLSFLESSMQCSARKRDGGPFYTPFLASSLICRSKRGDDCDLGHGLGLDEQVFCPPSAMPADTNSITAKDLSKCSAALLQDLRDEHTAAGHPAGESNSMSYCPPYKDILPEHQEEYALVHQILYDGAPANNICAKMTATWLAHNCTGPNKTKYCLSRKVQSKCRGR